MKRKVVALTGGIGSGKSTVAEILSQEGFDVLDCDILAREVSCESHLLQQVAELLGEECVVNGALNRRKIRQVVFEDEELYRKYCALFWQPIKKALIEKLQNLGKVVFVQIPVTEAFDFDWQEIWLVESQRETRINRVIKRDNVSADNVLDIMSKQSDCLCYTRKIENDGSLQELRAKVLDLLKCANLL